MPNLDPTPFMQKRMGRVLLNEEFVTSCRGNDVFKNFAVLLAMPRYNEPGVIAYYGAHPDFEPFTGVPKDAPYYDPYWNDDGFYFKMHEEGPPVDPYAVWMRNLDNLMIANFNMRHDDFEEYSWRDEFDADVPVHDAFEEWRIHTENGARSPGRV